MFFRKLVSILFLLSIVGVSNAAPKVLDISGIYEVERATLNVSSCEQEGNTTDYASKYFRVSGNPDNGYSVAICNGESLDEIECVGGYRATHLSNEAKHGLQGYNYDAHLGHAIDGTPQCRLHALRRKIVPVAGDYVRYERTDWAETLSDFIAECDKPMAETYSNVDSLKCSNHIVIFGRKVANSDTQDNR